MTEETDEGNNKEERGENEMEREARDTNNCQNRKQTDEGHQRSTSFDNNEKSFLIPFK